MVLILKDPTNKVMDGFIKQLKQSEIEKDVSIIQYKGEELKWIE